jgi:hypothetical protein
MRNPMNSWDSSDSYEKCVHGPCAECKKDVKHVTIIYIQKMHNAIRRQLI